MALTDEVRAAGGMVVRRPTKDAPIEVLVVHRPRYDDWSLPKGKLLPGEEDLDAALREVEEETGLSCEPLHELRTVRYRDRSGRMKVVRYWMMRPLRGEFVPGHEVDEIRWLPLEETVALLSYLHDRELVRSASPDASG